MKKTIISTLIIVFTLGIFSFSKVNASVTENISGWLWGGSDDGAGNKTGLGWISLNNTNTGTAVSYGANISSIDGVMSGYGWSENIGWISFNSGDLSGCPSGSCTARRAGNNIQGWARIISIRDALTVGNSGGWQGWIKLNGVTISGSNFSGYAWSDELGWIDFSRASIILPPEVTLTSDPDFVYLDEGETLPQEFELIWTVSGNVSDCTASSSDGSWNGSKSISGGTDTTQLNSPGVEYKISCTGAGGSDEAVKVVNSGCNNGECPREAVCSYGIKITGDSTDCNADCETNEDCEKEKFNWKEVAP
jgi:hypothetical protein